MSTVIFAMAFIVAKPPMMFEEDLKEMTEWEIFYRNKFHCANV
jgi:hypothetical protein